MSSIDKMKEAGEDIKEALQDGAHDLADKAGDLKDAAAEKAADLKDAAAEKAGDLKDEMCIRDRLKMVEYLAAFVGQSFSAVISGVAAWGIYVRLDCTAEGVLPVRALGDEYFVFDPVRYTIVRCV